MKKQQGLSLIGLIFVGGVLVFLAILGMKVLPSYVEFFTIQKHVKELGHSGAGMSAKDIQNNFDKRASIDDITSIQGRDLEVTKSGESVEISASYEKRVPLFANVSLLFAFEANSQ